MNFSQKLESNCKNYNFYTKNFAFQKLIVILHFKRQFDN